MKTIQEIQAEFGSASAGALNSYHEELDQIKAERNPEAGAYLDRLRDEQRMSLLRDQKTERASEITEHTRKVYTAGVETYRKALSERTGFLKERLFKVEDTGVLQRASLATDAELGVLLDTAELSGNLELGRAAFLAASRRGLGEHMATYFDRLDPEARDLYEEWTEIPPEEVLERQANNVEVLIPDPDPDALMPAAVGTT